MQPPNSQATRELNNWKIHTLYLQRNWDQCLTLIDDALSQSNGLSEFAIYAKALVLRQQGKIQESYSFFQAAACVSRDSLTALKQVGRSCYLLGKHRAAVEVFEQILKKNEDDWEVHHNKALCHMYLREYDKAIESFEMANDIQRHDVTFLQLGKVLMLQQNFERAIEVFQEALEFSPENPELLTTLGILHLRTGDNFKAFDALGNALTHDPTNSRAILAAGSIIQDHSDLDVALVKYRVAAVHTPDSAQLWNNIGMCFFGKKKYVAAVASLKRALYLDSFEWIIAYNLGLVHLVTQQYCSAFHYLSTSINLKADYAPSYAYLGVALSRLDDFHNARAAYEKSLELDRDCTVLLNYASTLFNHGEPEAAREKYREFEKLYEGLDEEVKNDPDMVNSRSMLNRLLNMAGN